MRSVDTDRYNPPAKLIFLLCILELAEPFTVIAMPLVSAQHAYLQSCVSEHKRTSFKLKLVRSSDAAPGTNELPQRGGLVQQTETIQPPHLPQNPCGPCQPPFPLLQEFIISVNMKLMAAGSSKEVTQVSMSKEDGRRQTIPFCLSTIVTECLAGGRNSDRWLS